MIRPATVRDVESIKALIDSHASRGLMLPRPMHELYGNVRDFVVYEDDRKVVGCAALHVFDAELAEVKSVAVDNGFKGKGIGRDLVGHTTKEARRLGLRHLFALTYVPGFFEKMGFQRLQDKKTLPQKIWTECINCPKFPNCDEEAVTLNLEADLKHE